jgi:flagellar assembly protein FliH
LHPDDLAMLDDAALVGWQIVPDAGLDRGGLLLEGADGAVADGPSEWRRAIAAALGA